MILNSHSFKGKVLQKTFILRNLNYLLSNKVKFMSLSAQEKSKIIKSMNELKSKNIDLSKKFYEIFLQNEEISTLFKFVPIETQKKMFKVSL